MKRAPQTSPTSVAPIRLAMLVNSFPSASETFLQSKAIALGAAGLDVTVLTHSPSPGIKTPGSPTIQRLSGLHHPVIFCPATWLHAMRILMNHRKARVRHGWYRDLRQIATLSFLASHFDIVHFEMSGIAIPYLDYLHTISAIPMFVSCRGAAEQVRPLVDPRRAKDLATLFSSADRIHCVSADILKTCQQYGLDPARAFVNRPAVDAARFSPPSTPRTSGPTCNLLSVARLHWKKGLEYALLAIDHLVREGTPVHWHLIGDGPEREKLIFMVHDLGLQEHVSLCGAADPSAIRAALQSCDIFLHPSLSEGISNAVLEAMSMGLPVVCVTSGGMSEVISDGVNGFLVPPYSPESLAEATRKLVASPTLRGALGCDARKRVLADFTIERQTAIFLQEYRSAVDARRSEPVHGS